MKILLITLLIVVSGFSQVNWEIEIVDSMVLTDYYDYTSNFLALDEYDTLHIVYNKVDSIIYSTKVDTNWQREFVETGLVYACFSLIYDKNNTAHMSYYRKNDTLNMTYLCYARRDAGAWQIEVVDSIYGILTNLWFSSGNCHTSIALDTFDLPGIAYTSWNPRDSLFYIKYAHFNGTNWNMSVVEYDTVWAPHLVPSDWWPALRFNRKNVPIIAFYQIYDNPQDTIKIAHFDDSLNSWIVEPAICGPYGGAAIWLALNSQDYPCIAHGWSAAVVYSWWDGLSWHTEATGATMGWVGIRIVLDLDSLDNPHILYRIDFSNINYCYKRNGIWYINNWLGTSIINISFSLDSNDHPHVSFRIIEWDSVNQINYVGIKYAKGTFTGIEERQTALPNILLTCLPNLTNADAAIKYTLPTKTRISLNVYDNCGRLVKEIFTGEKAAGVYSETLSLKNHPDGVYHLLFKTPDNTIARKIIKIEQ